MSQADDAVAFCIAQLGKPYVFGATGPNSFDCSGLIVAAYAQAHPPVHLVHFTGTMLLEGRPISQSQLQPGDLVFPDAAEEHVVIYIGNGQIIEAPHKDAVVTQKGLYGFWQGRRVTTDGLTPQGVTGNQVPTAEGTLTVDNPADTFKSAADAIGAFSKVSVKIFTSLASPNFWERVGAGIIALGLIIIGLLIAFRRPVGGAVKVVTGAVGGIAGEAAHTAVRFRTEQREMARAGIEPSNGGSGFSQTNHIYLPAAPTEPKPRASTASKGRHQAVETGKRESTRSLVRKEGEPISVEDMTKRQRKGQ